MSVRAFLADQGLPPVLEELELHGELTEGDRAFAPPALVRLEGGAFGAVAVDGEEGLWVDLQHARYQSRLMRDAFVTPDHTIEVPRGKGSAARELVARARCGPAVVSLPEAGRFIDELDPAPKAVIEGGLADGERVLCCLRTASEDTVESPLAEAEEVDLVWLLTDRRHVLVAAGSLGDSEWIDLPASPLSVGRSLGRIEVDAGFRSWTGALRTGGQFEEVSQAPALRGDERVLDVARALWVEDQNSPRVPTLVETIALPAAQVIRSVLEGAPTPGPLIASGVEGEALDRWCERWNLDVPVRRQLLDGASNPKTTLAMHERLHAEGRATVKDPVERALLDLAWAEHLLEAGQGSRAAPVLTGVLDGLPSEELSDLLPPADADLTEGDGGQGLRIRTLELLVRARQYTERHAQRIRELACLQPLVIERVDALLEAKPDLEAALRWRQVLLPGGLDPRDDVPEPEGPEEAAWERVIRHPAARSSGVLGALQGALATAKVPERTALKAYCERLNPQTYAGVQDLLSALAVAFGTPAIEAFVSRGDRAVGMRIYEGSPPFLLLGGAHLEAGPHHLTPRELAFALGAELAHLRFQHTRVTSDEVWAGAWEKGMAGVDVLLGVLPVFKGWKVADRLHKVTSVLESESLSRVLGRFEAARGPMDKLRSLFSNEGEHDGALGSRSDQLIAAHRVMQFTADRAGLLASGDVAAAVRAVFLQHPATAPELEVMRRLGLADWLRKRASDGDLAHQEVAVRLAALGSFWMSAEYGELVSG